MKEPDKLLDEVRGGLKDEWYRDTRWFRQRYGALQKLFNIAADHFHRFAEVNLELAEYHLEHGNFADAALRYRFVLWKQPKNADAWAGLGIALLRAGQRSKGSEVLKKALKLAPDNVRAAEALSSLNPPTPTP